jgi:hypothetical protein
MRIRSSGISSQYSLNWKYSSERSEMPRSVVRTVSSGKVGERGRNDITIVVRSVGPTARRAWCSIYWS